VCEGRRAEQDVEEVKADVFAPEGGPCAAQATKGIGD